MRQLVVLALVATLRLPALAVCPGADCFAGGGPASTDCFVAFDGMSSKTLSCTDGAACDRDGRADGVCTLDVRGCINVSGLPGCNPAGLDAAPTVAPAASPTAQQLAAALDALDRAGSGCTAPLALPLKLSLSGIKTGKARLTVKATSGGKRDTDRLKLVCTSSTTARSFSQAVQPIFTAKCAYSGCHDAFALPGRPILVAGMAYGQTVAAKATLGKLLRVKPRSIRGSDLAHRILGQGIPAGGTQMPQGCPTVVPPGCPAGTIEACCLTAQEKFTILSWIANGAPNN
jgi:hypothetical protein